MNERLTRVSAGDKMMLLVPLSKMNWRDLRRVELVFPLTEMADEVNPQKEVCSLSAKTRSPVIVANT